MPVSLDQFTQQLADSGLLSSADVQTLVEGLPAEKRPQDAEQLARELVRQKRLTAFQAQQIYAGKGKSLVLGNYVILDKLGQGGMGMVLKAEHRRMDRLVALKVLSPTVTKTPALLARFQREVKAAARLIHQNIVPAFDADEANGTHFLVMEYIEGADLASLVKKNGPLPPAKALSCIVQAAWGLEYAHQQGIVHRDIKPANLLLDNKGTLKILDMGLARLDAAGAAQDDLTGSGQIMGTVDYMAPEQAVNTKRADHRSDIYSLGVTLWYLLTAKPMYLGETPIEKLMAHQTQSIPSLRGACPTVTTALERVFNLMVAKTPEDRYQTMGECLADMQQCLGDSGGSAPSIGSGSGENARLDRLLRGATSQPEALGEQQASSAAATAAVEPLPEFKLPQGSLDVTIDAGSPQVGTNPNLEWPPGLSNNPLPSRERVAAQPPSQRARQSSISNLKSQIAKSQLWGNRRALISAFCLGLLMLLLAAWAILKKPEVEGVGSVNHPLINAEGWHRWSGDAPPPAIAPFDAAQAQAHQEAWGKHLGVPVEYENSIGMKFRLIPPGEFLMGGTPEEIADALKAVGGDEHWQRCVRSETPQHKAVLSRPIYCSIHEVTQKEYDHVMRTNPSYFAATGGGKDAVAGMDTATHPVETVSWNDAAEFCAKLSEQEKLKPNYSRDFAAVTMLSGAGYRLPTEAEWEFACRAGTTTKYWSGETDESLAQVDWFGVNSGGRTHAAGERMANPLGLFDIHGNVWEWVQDWWEPSYYEQFVEQPATDPSGPSLATGQRVIRGGNRGYAAFHCRSSVRGALEPTGRGDNVGFRVALTVAAVQAALAKKPPAEIRDSDGAVDLLPLVDLQADVPDGGGGWKREGQSLRSPQQDYARVAIPVELRGDYEATIEFTRKIGDGAVDLFLPVAERHVQFVIDGWNGIGLSGLQAVEGRDAPDPAKNEGVTGQRLENGRRYVAQISVRTGGAQAMIAVQLDRKPFVTWTGPAASLSLIDSRFNMAQLHVLGVGAWSSVVDFHSVKLRILQGEARLLRNKGVAKLTLGEWHANAPLPAIAPFDAERAEKHQQAWSDYLQSPVEYENSIGMKFRLIPAGEYFMGSSDEDVRRELVRAGDDKHWRSCIEGERPRHRVVITRPFYLGVHEVRQLDYQTVIQANPSHFATTGAGVEAVRGLDTSEHPVDNVNWRDAVDFCLQLSRREEFTSCYHGALNGVQPIAGTGYRLPTEAEWEFACRAGTATQYYSGDSDEDVARTAWFGETAGGRTHRTGELSANALGLFDMHGNVWEWCQDGWQPDYYSQFSAMATIDPCAPVPTNQERIIRGGTWDGAAAYCRSANRNGADPTLRVFHLGFRVVLSVEAVRQSSNKDPRSSDQDSPGRQ